MRGKKQALKKQQMVYKTLFRKSQRKMTPFCVPNKLMEIKSYNFYLPVIKVFSVNFIGNVL